MAQLVVALQIDDGVAVTLDVSTAEADAIEGFLRAREQPLQLAHGASRADSARMMCFNRSMSEHLHFCDAAVGPYWQAATALKQRAASA
jgi:hypothetical protein